MTDCAPLGERAGSPSNTMWPGPRPTCTPSFITNQDETRHAGRPRPWPHCVRGDPGPPPQRGTDPQFSAHVYCAQTAEWIQMPLGMEVGLGSGHIVLDGDPAPLPKGGIPSVKFWPMFVVVRRLDGSKCHLVRRYASAQTIVLHIGTQLPVQNGHSLPQFSAHVYCGQTVAHLSYC